MKKKEEIEVLELNVSDDVRRGFAKFRAQGIEEVITANWWGKDAGEIHLEICHYPGWIDMTEDHPLVGHWPSLCGP